MAAADPVTPEPRRFSIRLPRPLWIGVAAAALLAVLCGLKFGLGIYRERSAIREIERLGGACSIESSGPEWIRRLAGKERTWIFDKVHHVRLIGMHVTDEKVKFLFTLRDLRFLQLQGTNVTYDTIDDLRRAFPRLNMIGPSGEALPALGSGK